MSVNAGAQGVLGRNDFVTGAASAAGDASTDGGEIRGVSRKWSTRKLGDRGRFGCVLSENHDADASEPEQDEREEDHTESLGDDRAEAVGTVRHELGLLFEEDWPGVS